MALTEEQKALIEENRQRALAKRHSNSQMCQRSNIASNNNCSSTANHGKNDAKSAWNVVKSDAVKPKPTFTVQKRAIQGVCVLVDVDRFEVRVGYDEGLVSLLKSLKSARYEASRRVWSLHVKDHAKFVQSATKLRPNVVVEGLPKWIVDIFVQEKTETDSPNNLDKFVEQLEGRLDNTLLQQLMPFQKQGVAFGLKHEGRVLLADDMGLGKTIQALGIASLYRSEWPLLVVCPSSLRFSWREAVVRWIESVIEEDILVATTGKDDLIGGQVVIMSYDLLSRRQRELEGLAFKVIIFDESHYLKNYQSNRTRSAASIAKRSNRLLLLSGTPALSRPKELFSQLEMLKVRHLPKAIPFGMRYCDGKKVMFGRDRFHHDFSGCSNMEELKIFMQRTCLLRRLKSDVLSQLPSKQRQLIILDPGHVKNKSSMTKHSLNLEKHKLSSSAKRRGLLLEWFNATAEAKCEAVGDYIKELIDDSVKKIICFAHHQVMLDHLASIISSVKVGYIRIDGSTSSSNRHEYCNAFQTDDNIRVALLSVTAANTGLTLTAAQLVVFAELFWNPGMLCQAEDRAHRIGQTDCVVVQYLVAKGTADDQLWPLLQKKLEVLNKAGLSKDNFSDSSCAPTKTTKHENEGTDEVEEEDDWLEDDQLLLDLCSAASPTSGFGCEDNIGTPRKRAKLNGQQ